MMLDKNTKAMFHSPNGDTNFFDIVICVFQRDALCSFILCLDYTSNERICVHIKKGKKQVIFHRNYDRLRLR